MNYKKIHDEIIARGQSRAITRKAANNLLGGYCEEHHVIPKCFFKDDSKDDSIGWLEGDPNDKNNLVFLSAREHYIIHQLLVKIYPGNKQISFACFMMTWDKYGHRVNNRLYEWVKKQHAANISASRKGKTKETCTIVAKIVKTKADNGHHFAGKTKENCSGLAAMSEKKLGRNKYNHEGTARQSETRKGWTKETHPATAAQADAMRGRTKENNEGLARMAEKLTKVPIEVKIEIYNRRMAGIPGAEVYKWLTEELGYEVHSSFVSAAYNSIKRKASKAEILEDSDFTHE